MTKSDSSATSVPLSAPLYGASFGQAFVRYWKKYATFSGRASRSEYWWMAIPGAIAAAITLSIYIPSLLAARTAGGGIRINAGIVATIILALVFLVVTIVPTVALTWRRLHDANLSGAFWLLSFVPTFGAITMLVLTLLPSRPEGSRFDA